MHQTWGVPAPTPRPLAWLCRASSRSPTLPEGAPWLSSHNAPLMAGGGEAAAWTTPSLYPAPTGLPTPSPQLTLHSAPRLWASACGILSPWKDSPPGPSLPMAPSACDVPHPSEPCSRATPCRKGPRLAGSGLLRWAGSTPPPSEDPGTFCLWQNQCGSVCLSIRVTLQHGVLAPGVYLGHQGTCQPQCPRRQLGKLFPSGWGGALGSVSVQL